MSEPSILILDDESEMRALLQRFLASQGFAVQVATNSQQLKRLLARRSFDVVVLDLMMPGESVLEICRRLRAAGDTIPIMMLTAKGDPVDRIVGLEMGADDYLPKPFEPRELAARLHAMVRRQTMYGDGTGGTSKEIIQFGQFCLDLGSRTLMLEGEPVALTSGCTMAQARAMSASRSRPQWRKTRSASVWPITDRASRPIRWSGYANRSPRRRSAQQECKFRPRPGHYRTYRAPARRQAGAGESRTARLGSKSPPAVG